MVRHKLFGMVVVAVPLVLSAPLAAHHGSASFDVGKLLTLKGHGDGMGLVQSALLPED